MSRPEVGIVEDVLEEQLPEVIALGICDCGVPGGKMVQLYLTRRNLLALLNKLDANVKAPGTSRATLIKRDNLHPKYPNSHGEIYVTAVEDEEYYGTAERSAGVVKWFGEGN